MLRPPPIQRHAIVQVACCCKASPKICFTTTFILQWILFEYTKFQTPRECCCCSKYRTHLLMKCRQVIPKYYLEHATSLRLQIHKKGLLLVLCEDTGWLQIHKKGLLFMQCVYIGWICQALCWLAQLFQWQFHPPNQLFNSHSMPQSPYCNMTGTRDFTHKLYHEVSTYSEPVFV